MPINSRIIFQVAAPCAGGLGLLSLNSPSREYGIMVNYNGQADMLLSLQIPPDYYPFQFKKTSLHDYLVNPGRYMVSNNMTSEGKRTLKRELPGRLRGLLGRVREFGPSLWNEDIYKSGSDHRNDQFWNNKRTSLLLMEQFFMDDHVSMDGAYSRLPSFGRLAVTNHRVARDPYTIFPEGVFNCYSGEKNCPDDSRAIATALRKYTEGYAKERPDSLYRFGKYITFWNGLMRGDDEMGKLLKGNGVFSLNLEEDGHLAHHYGDNVFSREELGRLREWDSRWKPNYQVRPGIQLSHHAALEHASLPGSAPLSEGSQKDMALFLHQFSTIIGGLINDDVFRGKFATDSRFINMASAIENAGKISSNLGDRFAKIRAYFKAIGVVDRNFDPDSPSPTNEKSKTLMVLGFPPSSFGSGHITIQSMSKFPFIYRDIGLRQPSPRGWTGDELFSVDDNGWWWDLGNSHLDPDRMSSFKGSSDTVLLLSNGEDWPLLRNDVTMRAVNLLLREKTPTVPDLINTSGYPVSHSNYHLWNEGVRAPLTLNLLLDSLVNAIQVQYDPLFTSPELYSGAMDWGSYWVDDFLGR